MTAPHELGTGSMEGRHLAESIALVRGDIRELREELRDTTSRRVTHGELAAFSQLYDTKLTGLEIRYSEHVDQLKTRIKDLEDKAEEDVTERRKMQRQLVYSIIGGVAVALVATVVTAVVARMLS